MSTEQLRRQAKRLSKILPSYDFIKNPITLALSQEIVARQHGFASFHEANVRLKERHDDRSKGASESEMDLVKSGRDSDLHSHTRTIDLTKIERHGVLCCEGFTFFSTTGPKADYRFGEFARFGSVPQSQIFNCTMSLYVVRHSPGACMLVVIPDSRIGSKAMHDGVIMNHDGFRRHFVSRALRAVGTSEAFQSLRASEQSSEKHVKTVLEIESVLFGYNAGVSRQRHCSVYSSKYPERFRCAVHWTCAGWSDPKHRATVDNLERALLDGAEVDTDTMLMLIDLNGCVQRSVRVVDDARDRGLDEDDIHGLLNVFQHPSTEITQKRLSSLHVTLQAANMTGLLLDAEALEVTVDIRGEAWSWLSAFVKAYSEYYTGLQRCLEHRAGLEYFQYKHGRLQIGPEALKAVKDHSIRIGSSQIDLSKLLFSKKSEPLSVDFEKVVALYCATALSAKAVLDALCQAASEADNAVLVLCRSKESGFLESLDGIALRHSVIVEHGLLNAGVTEVHENVNAFESLVDQNSNSIVIIEDAGVLDDLGVLKDLLESAKVRYCQILLLESEEKYFTMLQAKSEIGYSAVALDEDTVNFAQGFCSERLKTGSTKFLEKLSRFKTEKAKHVVFHDRKASNLILAW